MNRFFVGVDVGQIRDYTALAIVKLVDSPLPVAASVGQSYGQPPFQLRGPKPKHHLVHLKRYPLGLPYPEMAREIGRMMSDPKLPRESQLIVDTTGVGKPFLDQLHHERLFPRGVTITAGDAESRDGSLYRVPKRDLVSRVQILLQDERLKVAPSLKWWPTCKEELLHFKVKIDPLTAHDSYGYAREGVHDDLVLALCLACWGAKDFDYPSQPPFEFRTGIVPRNFGFATGSAMDL